MISPGNEVKTSVENGSSTSLDLRLSFSEPGKPSPAQSSDSNEGCSYPDTVEEDEEEEEEEVESIDIACLFSLDEFPSKEEIFSSLPPSLTGSVALGSNMTLALKIMLVRLNMGSSIYER